MVDTSVNPLHKRIVGVVDRYKGIEIKDLSSLFDKEEDFDVQLQWNMEQWQIEGIRSIQFKFAPPKCHLMNIAAKNGFYFHHANRTENYVLMCMWTDPTTHDKIPAYADHYVGVGGVVINQKDEILLIQEQRQPEPKLWKFPGGFMDPGETIKQAVEREVLEETGVRTEFQGIIGLRETLDARYCATDLYIVCLMSCCSETCDGQLINIIDKREIFQAKWVPLTELSSNNEGEAKYRMFPNAWKFVKSLHKRMMLYKEHRLPGVVEESDLSATQLMKKVTMTYDQVVSSSGKGKPWGYYISEALQFNPDPEEEGKSPGVLE